ncbi:hypothetical protein DH2020_026431 [Rehmannia glutinosa]|uniref:Cholesterol oxidase n=1 Tax=Rehmannia glutinosa TaxID=99300 RepID=A0ABR0VZY3_REHGL
MSRYRSTSVHLLGGCIASPDVSSGVCNSDGQVFNNASPTGVHTGLYICDASIIPCSVGINPCLTIAAVAEHVSKNLVRNAVNYTGNSVSFNRDRGGFSKRNTNKSCKSEAVAKETMRGQIGGMPCTAYLKLRYVLEGTKIMNPYLLALYAWKESTTLHVTLRKIINNVGEKTMILKGNLRISLLELLKSMCTLEGGSRKDDCIISCQHWQCSNSPQQLNQDKKLYPVLLINGYSTESYCLSTEPNDLVRTILKQGHDVFLLRPRLHPSNPSDDFSIEDIGRVDIPAGKSTFANTIYTFQLSIFLASSKCSVMFFLLAAIKKIVLLYGESVKVHVVAHCVGGLAIHISIMGGHVSAKHIASLSCTNSSMFFKLTTSSLVKMWLPLIPMSMAIMGKKKTLPLLQTSTTVFRHRLLKSIARLIPRYERCTCDECEVFSGIFGNTFWHENISHAMHYWMNKEHLTRLPMAAFSHLRRICNAGFIVDSKGNNSYLIHPERMAMPTLYVSGGRTLLVTPQTSFLANKYMKLHQPGYRHERVVIDGFGHSDLLIGEKSHEKVFHTFRNILSWLKMKGVF